MKYTFIATDINEPFSGYTNHKQLVEFEADNLTVILSMFEDFLKGNGFRLDGQSLELVDNNETQPDIDIDDQCFISTACMNDSLSMGAGQPTVTFPFVDDDSNDQTFLFTTEDLAKNSMANIESALNNVDMEERCPVCRLKKSQMEGMTCFDPRCGLGKNSTTPGNYYS